MRFSRASLPRAPSTSTPTTSGPSRTPRRSIGSLISSADTTATAEGVTVRPEPGRFSGGLTAPFAELGEIAALGWKTTVAAVRPPFTFGHEFVTQFNFAVRLASLPMILSAFALGFGPAGVQAGGFLKLFGALDRLGGLFVLAVIREFGPSVCAIVVAGVAGTAICADLGARKIREEIDALMVLGVDPVKSLVVPRFLALVAVTSLFNVYALVFGTLAGMLVTLTNGASLGPFFATYFSNASTLEFGASMVKTALFGGAIALICCFKGLNASGGAEGVGRAVNQAVVMAFLTFGTINYVFTQVLLATNPSLSIPR